MNRCKFTNNFSNTQIMKEKNAIEHALPHRIVMSSRNSLTYDKVDYTNSIGYVNFIIIVHISGGLKEHRVRLADNVIDYADGIGDIHNTVIVHITRNESLGQLDIETIFKSAG